jgi:hypothetical protein
MFYISYLVETVFHLIFTSFSLSLCLYVCACVYYFAFVFCKYKYLQPRFLWFPYFCIVISLWDSPKDLCSAIHVTVSSPPTVRSTGCHCRNDSVWYSTSWKASSHSLKEASCHAVSSPVGKNMQEVRPSCQQPAIISMSVRVTLDTGHQGPSKSSLDHCGWCFHCHFMKRPDTGQTAQPSHSLNSDVQEIGEAVSGYSCFSHLTLG